jgi:2-polyprenyl-6-methoxyphenol hydroxylase-like FAD-dependent oxidoreductase
MPVRLESALREVTNRPTGCAGPLHVLVVGAGIGGLALADGLRRAGVSCALYEAECSGVLMECLPPDLVGLADQVHFGKEFTHYRRRADGTVTAFFADGGSASGQALVGADGSHSAVRARYLRELIPRRHLGIRRFYPGKNPAAGFPLRVAGTRLAPAWQATNVTLVGDAIHAVTPGPPVGANTALRDAMLLTRALSFVQANRIGLSNAVAAYEAEMIRFDPARLADLRIPG